ncbi:class I SAM-dependent RNA methyltransferase [Magnetovibrio sp.]|uniref:class I SAM-dependent RNA methyltransferase n=1 Tax=Magnetovibrio sp. TaxID=2024836 RepID=UPI002F958BFE
MAKVPQQTVEVVVDKLGAHGDGVASADILGRRQNLFIAGALPGERVVAETVAKRGDGLVANLVDILQSSADRAEPGCRLFETCGGCALQHLGTQAYAMWKRERVAQALRQRGFDAPPVLEPVLIGEGTRRRVTFTALKRAKHVTLGFNARSSHDIVAVDHCPLLDDALNALIAPLSEALHGILDDGARARINVTACENGADVLIEGNASPDLKAREALAVFVQNTPSVRVAWKEEGLAAEPIAQVAVPLVYLSGVPVELPSGTFLQASVEGEHAIRDAVLAGVGADAARVADLFCGLGSFSIPLAQQAIVTAADAVEAPVRALERAAGRAGLGGRVVAQVRDLSRQPFDEAELSKFDAVVFDPPRAGAADQVRYLAESRVPRVVAVSCNPATFARDARTLVDGGYRLLAVQPIDQFTYSAHIELVAHFTR